MKKVFIVMAIGAFLFAAASSYACGNKSSAGASKVSATNSDAKVKTADATCPSTAACPAGSKQCSDAKAANADACPNMNDATAKHADVKTAGSESCPYMKDASAQKANASGCCSGSKAKASKASSASVESKAKDELVSKDKKDTNPVLLISAPAQSSASSK